MDDKEVTFISKVVVSYHPTDRDKRGYDGVYIKESIMLPGDTIDVLQYKLDDTKMELAFITGQRDALQRKLDIATEALKKIGSKTYMGKHPMELAQEALKQLEEHE